MAEARPSVDLEAYCTRYAGRACTIRALFVASKKDPSTERHALSIAAADLRANTADTALYTEVVSRLNAACAAYASQHMMDVQGGTANMAARQTSRDAHPLSSEAIVPQEFDEQWVKETDTRSRAQLEKLEAELNGYKTNQIKESIRMGHNDLGDFFVRRGLLELALRNYIKTRDYCVTSKHIVQMCLNVIRVAMEMREFSVVENYVQRAEQAPDVLNDPILVVKLSCCAGLASLAKGNYDRAAFQFASCSLGPNEEHTEGLSESLSELVALDDVALYGGLTALATFSREELDSKVIQPTAPFRGFLEIYPEMREIINDFHNSRYSSALANLEGMLPDLKMDMFLDKHVQKLCAMIRAKALLQYVTPYTVVDLNVMASAFHTHVTGLSAELENLIDENQMAGRIDVNCAILHRKSINSRAAMLNQALMHVQDCFIDLETALLRMHMNRANLEIKGHSARQDGMNGDERELAIE
ncbi:COP9 signalosome complex subunit 1 [Porphyridium purpureum]|uniref:COP9 signalosome complex subunit 1 n=1 Tax=Porphyridium purpureum TaxID=35688 RepID=A0A5J4YVP8_PORPP|nr:COP9 signalosome complex subunit 1 [Porphyridium purpureum]|eukprot:POR5681..scf209_3